MAPTYFDILKNAADLPDSALVTREIGAILMNRSTRSLRRKSPVPGIKTGERTGGYRMGDIRALQISLAK